MPLPDLDFMTSLIIVTQQVVERLEEENSILKENIQILEDSTTVSYRRSVSAVSLWFDFSGNSSKEIRVCLVLGSVFCL